MTDRSDGQRGAQMHPEGGHGDRTREQHREQLESGPSEARADDAAPPMRPGKHRIHEDREQHDEADLRSEQNRLAREPGNDSRGRSR